MTTWTSVNSMTNLKAQSAGTYQSVEVLGYYAPGDGGGGDFFWNSSSTAPDNGGTTIMPTSKPATGRWQRLVSDSISARWFGVKADGSTDTTTALQSAINAAAGGTLILPPGQIVVSRSLNFNQAPYAYRIVGVGAGPWQSGVQAGSAIMWNGPNNVPLFNLQGIRNSEFSDFSVNASSRAPLQVAFQSTTISGRTSRHNVFNNILMDGTTTAIGKGWQYITGSGGDNNNDCNTFRNCVVNNFATAAWSFEHSQAKAHRFFGCWFYGGSGGPATQYGVTTALGSGPVGGSFVFYGGGGGGCQEADFYLGGPDDAVIISGSNFEGSGRFFENSGGSTNAYPVTIESCRWAGNTLNADGKAVIYLDCGPFNFIGNTIGDGAGTMALQIYADTWAPSGGCATAIGNTIYSTLSQPFTTNGTDTHWTAIGNNRNSGPTTIMENAL